MIYERMLAWRYIKEQKRHSLLTVCSIVVAVAMIAMLFSCAACLMHTVRAHILNTEFPHHAAVLGVTDAQEAEITAMDGIRAVGRYEKGSLATGEQDCRYTAHSLAAQIDECMEDYADNSAVYAIWIDFEFHIVVYEQDTPKLLQIGGRDPQAILRDIGNLEGTECIANFSLLSVDIMTNDARLEMAILFGTFYVFVCFLAIMLRLVIDTAFEISAKERERQFGVLQSVGATPPQIVRIMTHEGMLLSVAGVPLGLLAGTSLAYLVYRTGMSAGLLQWVWGSSQAVLDAPFRLSPVGLGVSAVTGAAWVFFSAYGTGLRVIKMAPVEAISGSQTRIMKVRKHRLANRLFGWTGMLAARNVRRQKKRFLVTVLSLTLSITLIGSTSLILDTVQTFYAEGMTAYDNSASFKLSYDCDIFACIASTDKSQLAYQPFVKKLEESGLFASVSPLLSWTGSFGDRNGIEISYLRQEEYDRIYEPVLHMPYSALGEGYLLVRTEDFSIPDACFADGGKTLTVTQPRIQEITEEEARALAQAEVDKQKAAGKLDDATEEELEDAFYKVLDRYIRSESFDSTTNTLTTVYGTICQEPAALTLTDTHIITESEAEQLGSDAILIATQDYFERGEAPRELLSTGWNEYRFIEIRCVLLHEDADEAGQAETLIHSLYEVPDWSYTSSFILERVATERMLRTVRYICNILMALFALIAVVSMVNIISTGILNRRSELGAMCTLGMTNGQLVRLILTECAQYVLTSGITAAALTMLLIALTKEMLGELTLPEMIEKFHISYLSPLPMLLLATGCAFAIAAATSLLSLHRLTREPLIESIRTVE